MSPTATSFSFVSQTAIRRITRWSPHFIGTHVTDGDHGALVTTPVDVTVALRRPMMWTSDELAVGCLRNTCFGSVSSNPI